VQALLAILNTVRQIDLLVLLAFFLLSALGALSLGRRFRSTASGGGGQTRASSKTEGSV
jgi:hypothetical protein